MTENHWLRSNIRERLVDLNSTFIVTMEQIDYDNIPFDRASEQVVNKIVDKYENIYIPLSGGMDSEYVFNCFVDQKFTPIIVDTPANKTESEYAYRRCETAKIKPVVIKKTEKEMLETYYNEIYKKLNGKGINSTAAYIAAKYANDNNGVAVIAEHGYDGFNEWDFYNDALIHEENSIYFFMYDRTIFESMKREYQKGENHQLFKNRLYNVPLRLKMHYKHSANCVSVYQKMLKAINTR